jgi:glycerol kinase
VAWRIGGGVDYCVDGQVFTVASAVRWLIDVGLISAADRIDSVVPADAGGVLCVPALAGLAAPWWRPDATATFTGITLSSTAGHLVLAVLQGIAAQVAALTRSIAMDLGVPLTTLRVDGGLTRSAVLMQSVADLTQLPVEVYASAHATALGAAALGRLCLQPGLPMSEAVLDWAPSLTYRPRWTPDRAAEFRQSWQRAADHNLPDEESS